MSTRCTTSQGARSNLDNKFTHTTNNMAATNTITEPVPAFMKALSYLNDVAPGHFSTLYDGGVDSIQSIG